MPPYFTSRFIFQAREVDRLDRLLVAQFPARSRSYFQYLIDMKAVSVNGALANKGRRTEIGDRIEVAFPLAKEIELAPEPIPLDVIFEDEHLICVNKPPGMVVHPSPGHLKGTFVHALLHHCRGVSLPGKGHRPGIVHRLDKETSGVLLAAKSEECYQRLIAQFKERVIEKEYVAITVGHPSAREICAPIGRDPLCRKKMAVSEKGKRAMTVINPLERGQNFSLISARPFTGRTHQIRIHLKYNHTPILGDSTYGLAKVNVRYQVLRQQLHAARIRLSHPIKDEILSFSAPLPLDMKQRSEDFFGGSSTLRCLPIC